MARRAEGDALGGVGRVGPDARRRPAGARARPRGRTGGRARPARGLWVIGVSMRAGGTGHANDTHTRSRPDGPARTRLPGSRPGTYDGQDPSQHLVRGSSESVLMTAGCRSPRCPGRAWRFLHGDRDVRSRVQAVRRGGRRLGPQPRDQGRRVHGARRALGLRQDDEPADDRRARGDHRGRAPHRRQGRQRRRPQGPRHRDGVPELRALPAHVGPRQPGLRPQAAQACPRPTSTSGSTRPPRPSSSRRCSSASPRSSPAASASASRSAGRSCASRRCS